MQTEPEFGKKYVGAPHLTTGAKQAPTLPSSHRCRVLGFRGQRGLRVTNSKLISLIFSSDLHQLMSGADFAIVS